MSMRQSIRESWHVLPNEAILTPINMIQESQNNPSLNSANRYRYADTKTPSHVDQKIQILYCAQSRCQTPNPNNLEIGNTSKSQDASSPKPSASSVIHVADDHDLTHHWEGFNFKITKMQDPERWTVFLSRISLFGTLFLLIKSQDHISP
jgi:hypothetical protein